MKKLFLLPFLFLAVCATAQISKLVPDRPSPARLVNDFTNTLTREQADELERKLVAYDDSTSNQIVILIMSSTKDYPIEDVALQVLRQWGVGNKKTNNGMVILVAKDDRKARIEVGYGLEGAIPDMIAASIIDHEMSPNFKEGKYYRGLDEATSAIFKAAAGEYKAPEGYRKKGGKGIGFGAIIFIIILLIVFAGGRGGGGGGMASRRGYRDFGAGWLIGTLLSGGGGSGGGGGGWSGGGGGGGFGGFGGGSGGGGGASGSW